MSFESIEMTITEGDHANFTLVLNNLPDGGLGSMFTVDITQTDSKSGTVINYVNIILLIVGLHQCVLSVFSF